MTTRLEFTSKADFRQLLNGVMSPFGDEGDDGSIRSRQKTITRHAIVEAAKSLISVSRILQAEGGKEEENWQKNFCVVPAQPK